MKIADHIALSADKILMYFVDGAYSTFFFKFAYTCIQGYHSVSHVGYYVHVVFVFFYALLLLLSD